MTTLPWNLKKITLYLSLIFTKEIFNGKVRVRSKVSSSIWDQKWACQYLLAPEPGPTWVISSWWLSVYDPMTSAFLLSLLNAKKNQHWYQDWVWLTWMKETNMVYYEISDTVHLIGISKFIKFYIRHQFWKPKLTILLIFHYLQSVPKI